MRLIVPHQLKECMLDKIRGLQGKSITVTAIIEAAT